MSNRALIVLTIALLCSPAAAQEWTRFRGANGEGVSAAKTVPTLFGEKDFNWKVKLPGEGHGSVVVWGDRVFLQSGDEKAGERIVIALGVADGRTLWTKSFSTKPYRHHQLNSVGVSTPAVDAERVYVYLPSEEMAAVAALDHEGKQLWKYDIGPFNSKHGAATSPMVYKDIVVVTNDQDDKSSIVAVDKKTGQLKWSIPRKFSNNGASYAVPCVVEREGDKPQLIFGSANNGLTSVDPETGKVNWEMGTLMPLRVVASLIVADGLIIVQCGEGGGGKKCVAVKPGSADGTKQPEVAWEMKRNIPYVPTSVVFGGHVYSVTDGGIAGCMKLADGEVIWNERLDDKYFGSPVCVNGVIYCIGRGGDLAVFRASEKFELLGKVKLGEASNSTPAVAGGRMYLRTATQLISVGGKNVN